MHAYGTTNRLGFADFGKTLMKRNRPDRPADAGLIRTIRKQKRTARQKGRMEIARQMND